MLVLALDTTNEKGGVGIFRAGQCLASVPNHGPANRYSVTLFQMLDQALQESRLHLADIELFAVANGPGSFTGIRVGLAAAQGWGRAFDRPVRGVSVLEAMVEEAQPETEWAVPVLDARRGEFFLRLFRRASDDASGGRAFVPEGEGWVLKPAGMLGFLRDHLPSQAGVSCLVREHDLAAFNLREHLPASFHWQRIPGTLLAPIARLGVAAHQMGRSSAPAELDAYYIRRPDAEVNWKG